jgi:MYXO-CTERM domain-containing protein
MARCDLATNRCTAVPVPGCCTVDADCDDGLACTVDNCNPITGACTARATPGCCVSDGDCDDGLACTADACMRAPGAPTGVCAGTPIAGCCVADADCGEVDGDLCTVPSCNVVAGRCVEGPLSCDDGDPCTADACAADGACTHAPIAGCGMDDAGMLMGDDAGMTMGDDAGMMMGDDAGTMSRIDAGFTNDAATARGDAAVDAGDLTRVDAGLGDTDAGDLTVSPSGCGCRVPGPAGDERAPLALAVLGLLGLVARRQRWRSERA